MDIDIDIKNDIDDILKIFPEAIRASMIINEELMPHNVGIYFQTIPKDCVTNLSAIPYDIAEDYGYLKLDFLHVSYLEPLISKEGIRELITYEPNWDLLKIPSVVEKLFHINKYYDLIQQLNPRSIEDIADLLSLIRPGKKYLLDMYLENKLKTREILYIKPKKGEYYFKKSHAIAYAMIIILQLHMILEEIT